MTSAPSKKYGTGTYAVAATGAAVVTYLATRNSSSLKKHDDGIDLKYQTVEIDPVERIRRCTFYKDVDIYSYYKKYFPEVETLGDIFYHGYKMSGNGPCIGFVDFENKKDPLYWIPYKTALEQIRYIGSHLSINSGLKPTKSCVAILSANRAEYSFVEYACYTYGYIFVALYTTYDSSTIISILNRTETEVLVVDKLDRIGAFKDELFRKTCLKEILVMDKVQDGVDNRINDIPTILETFEPAKVQPRVKFDPESIATYILTSGTTGEPKLAMLSHTNILATIKSTIDRRHRTKMEGKPTNRHVSFLPLAHLYERLVLISAFLHGSQIVYCSVPERIFEYYPIVKPTNICMVPRVLNKVYDTIMAEVGKSRIKSFLIARALHNDQSSLFSRIIFRRVKNLFGGEAIGMFTGSAPITPEVLHFFRVALDIPFVEGYGQTESAAAGTSTHILDTTCGIVGTPGACVEIKLVDVPGTKYWSVNNQGEICVRGPSVFRGYFKDPEKTRETVDSAGWLHTGDVGEWTSSGALRIIDRTKHIFKLNQGEYIAPERLEDIYIRSRWVGQIFVDGVSTESTVVAIVVPDEEYLRKTLNNDQKNSSLAELCQNTDLKATILKDLQRLGREAKFKYYEVIHNIHLHPEQFSQENGLITSTLKTRRTAVREKFSAIIHALYTNTQNPVSTENPGPISKL